MKQVLFILAGLFLLVTSCRKEKLPKLTHEGKNTFGCKVNGKNWVPRGGGGLLNPLDALSGGFYRNINTIYIDALDNEEEIEIYLRDVFNTGEYALNFTTVPRPDNLYPKNYGLYTVSKNNATISYITTAAHTGKVNILNRDTINKIVSGTFEFTAVNNNGGTVKITEGRFDIKTH